jgi:hypothetical protein
MTKENKAVDITSFNSVDLCGKGEYMPLQLGGKEVGVDLLVLGKDADEVQTYETERLKGMARKSALAEKKKATLEFTLGLIDSIKQRDIDSAAARVIGWKGAGDFDAEKLKVALKNNPQWVEDIIDFSNDLTNFMKAS